MSRLFDTIMKYFDITNMRTRQASSKKNSLRMCSPKQSVSRNKQNQKQSSESKHDSHIQVEAKKKNSESQNSQENIHVTNQNVKKLKTVLFQLKKQVSDITQVQDFLALLKIKNQDKISKLLTIIKKLNSNSGFLTMVSMVPNSAKQEILDIFKCILKSENNKGNKKLIKSVEILTELLSKKGIETVERDKIQKDLNKKNPKRQYQSAMGMKVQRKGTISTKKPTPLKPKKQSSKVVLQVEKPLCPQAGCKNPLEDKICPSNNHLKVICQKCQWTDHKCQKTKELTDIKPGVVISMKAKGQKLNYFPSRTLPRMKQGQNNIKQMIIERSYKFMKEQRILPGVPEQIVCSYPIITGKAKDLVFRNRLEQDFLPLEIKKSEISGAGLGVFATTNINEVDTLVCSYRGEIGIGSRTPIMRNYGNKRVRNDSIFTLGWLGTEILIIAPNLYSNVGRFINFNTPQKCNLKPHLCLIQKSEKEYEIAVFLTTTKKIKAGDELFYNYGNDYYV